jgi:hypothetical protein
VTGRVKFGEIDVLVESHAIIRVELIAG